MSDIFNIFPNSVHPKLELGSINTDGTKKDAQRKRKNFWLQKAAFEIWVPIDSFINLSFEQNTVKTFKGDVKDLEWDSDNPLSPGEFDIVDEVFQQKEEHRYAVVIIAIIL